MKKRERERETIGLTSPLPSFCPLPGLCSEGIDLLQRYVDLTGDVQTVALVTIHTLQHAIAKDSRLSHWIQR